MKKTYEEEYWDWMFDDEDDLGGVFIKKDLQAS